jgi:hypothetical protein
MITARDILKNSEFFSIEEDFKDVDIDKVHYRLLEVLEVYRKFLGSRIHISPLDGSVYADISKKQHSEKSWHYIIDGRNKFSRAIDVFPDCPLYEALFLALRLQWGGIGVYPFADYKDKGIIREDTTRGMLHLDVRTSLNFRVLWWVDKEGNYNYINNVYDFEKLLDLIK